ncbi:hypothetical protein D3C71_2214930 [compost metagenome]
MDGAGACHSCLDAGCIAQGRIVLGIVVHHGAVDLADDAERYAPAGNRAMAAGFAAREKRFR